MHMYKSMQRFWCHRSISGDKIAFLVAKSFSRGAEAFVRGALFGMGLAVGLCMVSTVWYVLYCWCGTTAGGGWEGGCLSGARGCPMPPQWL